MPSNASNEPPEAFYDTRLQYALITDDRETLKRDYYMSLPPSWVERVAAGVMLPWTAAGEAVFWPFFTGIKAYSQSQSYGASTQ